MFKSLAITLTPLILAVMVSGACEGASGQEECWICDLDVGPPIFTWCEEVEEGGRNGCDDNPLRTYCSVEDYEECEGGGVGEDLEVLASGGVIRVEDGGVATVLDNDLAKGGEDQILRNCRGLIISRAYSEASAEAFRRATKRLTV